MTEYEKAEMQTKKELNKIEEAKKVLRQAGYFVDNLWHIEDVRSKFGDNVDEEVCQEVLEEALTNEWIMEQIFVTILDVGEDMGLVTNEFN